MTQVMQAMFDARIAPTDQRAGRDNDAAGSNLVELPKVDDV